MSEQVNKVNGMSDDFIAGVPVLETRRLMIRGFMLSDLDDYMVMVSDPEVVRYIADGEPLNSDMAWQSLAYMIGHWQLAGLGLWALEDKVSGRVIGRAGIYNAPGWFGPELGWMLCRDFQGIGLASEAAESIMKWYESNGTDKPLISVVHPDNKPALKLVKRLGGSFDEAVKVQDITALKFIYA